MAVNNDQHFLNNKEILQTISNTLSSTNDDTIIEIGGGKGALTQYLITKPYQKLLVFENDYKLLFYLKNFSKTNREIIGGNVLDYIPHYPHAKIIGNIPYSITEPLYRKLITTGINEAVLLHGRQFYTTIIQKESQWKYIIPAFFIIKKIQDVSGEEFDPPAKTTSVVVHLKKKTQLTSQDKFWQSYFYKQYSKIKNTLEYALSTNFNYTKNQVKELCAQLNETILEKTTSQLSRKEFREVINLLKKNNII